jgi:hypothetical protein
MASAVINKQVIQNYQNSTEVKYLIEQFYNNQETQDVVLKAHTFGIPI